MNVLSPQLASRLIPKRDVTNFLLIHTVVGTTLYIFSRPHLQSVETKKRVVYRYSRSRSTCTLGYCLSTIDFFISFACSILGSALFSFGSVLVWAIIRSSIPRNAALATGIGLASGFAIARLSYDYLNHIDNAVSGGKKSIAESNA